MGHHLPWSFNEALTLSVPFERKRLAPEPLMRETVGAGSTEELKRIAVHPTVLLSVADHHNRVAGKLGRTDRVIGMLLGEVFNGTVNCLMSFAVPFEEDQDDPTIWFVDTNYIDDMYQLHRKVTFREHIVGWYSSAPKLRPNDLDIHQLMRRYTPHPVFITTDVTASDPHEIPTAGFLGRERVRSDGQPIAQNFEALPTVIEYLEIEEVAVGHLLKDIKDQDVSEIGTTLGNSVHALAALESRLHDIGDYLDEMLRGDHKQDAEILGVCQDVFNLLPNLKLPATTEAVAVKSEEASFLVLVGQICRATVALHDLVNKRQDEKEKPAEKGTGKEKEGAKK